MKILVKNLVVLYDKYDFATGKSERLIRLPMWYGMSNKQLKRVASSFLEFYK